MPIDNERYRKAREELGDLLIQEEVFWSQRAMIFWLNESDINTRFFSSNVLIQKASKQVRKIKGRFWELGGRAARSM